MKHCNFNEADKALMDLAQRLRTARIERKDSQEIFSQRLSISRSTYMRMEQGDSSVAIGHWVDASYLLGELVKWDLIFKSEENLFDKYERLNKPQRKRVRAPLNNKK